MSRRPLPTLLALFLGISGLGAGLWSLHRVFEAERTDARAALSAREEALRQLALRTLADGLHAELEAVRPRIHAALEDPLAPSGELLVISRGRQLLPRAFDHAKVWPRAERFFRDMSVRLADAPPLLPSNVTRFLTLHRTFAPVDRLVLTLILAKNAPPEVREILLRTGGRLESGEEVPGLERALLELAHHLPQEDFDFLASQVLALGDRPAPDTFAAAIQLPGERVPVETPVKAPAIVSGSWYVEPMPDEVLHGTRVHLPSLIAAVREELRDKGLLAPEDALSVDPLSAGTVGRTVPLSQLRFDLTLRAHEEALRKLDERHRLKTGLLGGSGLMALGVVAFAFVAHERKRRYLALRESFVAAVSHELKTPVAAIRVMAETLERRVGGTERAGDYPTRIVAEADALSKLVDNVLAFQRLERGGWTVREDAVDLHALCTAICDEARGHASRPLHADLEGLRDVRLHGDPDLLRILFANLVRNACLYNARTPITVRVDAVKDERGVTVSVRDNGVGLPPSTHEAVFEEFRRLPAPGLAPTGGSGLGLAVCRRILRLHHGTIHVAASGPEGTTFELRFPRA